MFDEKNRKTYSDRGVVQYYTQLKLLQPAERAVLERLQGQLSSMKMLDIGVGGGRTTRHFSGVVKDYVGIDYSEDMIAACQAQFHSKSLTFEVCDARDMSRFQDNSFDFILFSFNGIDYVSHAERLKIFQEISRVGRPGGYFCFSSHNMQGLEQVFDWRNQVSFNPLNTYVNLAMWGILRLVNSSISLKDINASKHVIVRDESHNFRLETYYVRPQEQIIQLEATFRDISVYSWKSGLEISHDELAFCTDMWLYYLCVVK